MIPAIAIKKNSILTVYLKDKFIKGRAMGSEWGKVRFSGNKITSYDGSEYYESELEEFDISEVLAVGNTVNDSFVAKNDLCFELCALDRELAAEKSDSDR